jgi:hypothetical protein
LLSAIGLLTTIQAPLLDIFAPIASGGPCEVLYYAVFCQPLLSVTPLLMGSREDVLPAGAADEVSAPRRSTSCKQFLGVLLSLVPTAIYLGVRYGSYREQLDSAMSPWCGLEPLNKASMAADYWFLLAQACAVFLFSLAALRRYSGSTAGEPDRPGRSELRSFIVLTTLAQACFFVLLAIQPLQDAAYYVAYCLSAASVLGLGALFVLPVLRAACGCASGDSDPLRTVTVVVGGGGATSSAVAKLGSGRRLLSDDASQLQAFLEKDASPLTASFLAAVRRNAHQQKTGKATIAAAAATGGMFSVLGDSSKALSSPVGDSESVAGAAAGVDAAGAWAVPVSPRALTLTLQAVLSREDTLLCFERFLKVCFESVV